MARGGEDTDDGDFVPSSQMEFRGWMGRGKTASRGRGGTKSGGSGASQPTSTRTKAGAGREEGRQRREEEGGEKMTKEGRRMGSEEEAGRESRRKILSKSFMFVLLNEIFKELLLFVRQLKA